MKKNLKKLNFKTSTKNGHFEDIIKKTLAKFIFLSLKQALIS